MENYLLPGMGFTALGLVLLWLARMSPSDSTAERLCATVGFFLLTVGLIDLGPHALLHASWPFP